MFDAKVIRVLIASPSDVGDERAALREAIWEWNSQNGAEKTCVLLPVMWEHDSSPAFGQHPQAILNEQIVDPCDIVIGVFWTKLGTPTEGYESGTAEEIHRIVDRGGKAMLYFSDRELSPSKKNSVEYARLAEFKSSIKPRGLYVEYREVADLAKRIGRDLTRTVKELGIEISDPTPSQPSIHDQRLLDELLQLVPRQLIDTVREHSFGAAWQDSWITPFSEVAHEWHNTEHSFRDPAVESARSGFLNAVGGFCAVEAQNGFDHPVMPGWRYNGVRGADGPISPANALRGEERTASLENRVDQVIAAYNALIDVAHSANFSLNTSRRTRDLT